MHKINNKKEKITSKLQRRTKKMTSKSKHWYYVYLRKILKKKTNNIPEGEKIKY